MSTDNRAGQKGVRMQLNLTDRQYRMVHSAVQYAAEHFELSDGEFDLCRLSGNWVNENLSRDDYSRYLSELKDLLSHLTDYSQTV